MAEYTDLDLMIEERQFQNELAAAKAGVEAALAGRDRSSREVRADPAVVAARDVLTAVKLRHRSFKEFWRGIRHLQQSAAASGDPEALAKLTAELGAGSAIAAPVTHGMGIAPQEG